jgi:hypothetical protein
MGLDVSTFEDDALLLEITDLTTQVTTSFTGEYDWPLIWMDPSTWKNIPRLIADVAFLQHFLAEEVTRPD